MRDLAQGKRAKKRYLLFDSECMGCGGLARSVERETGGRVAARSLRDPHARKLLSETRPGWRWEPTLLEVEGGSAAVFTGLSMRLRLLAALGPRKAIRLAKLARGVKPKVEKSPPGALIGRGEALRTLGAAGLGAVTLSLVPRGALADGRDHKMEARAEPLSEEEMLEIFSEAQSDAGGAELWERLLDEGFSPELEEARGWNVSLESSSGSERGFVARIPFRDRDDVRATLLFSRFESRVRAGVGVYASAGRNGPSGAGREFEESASSASDSIKVLEVVGGEATHTETVANPHAAGSSSFGFSGSCDDCCVCGNVYQYLYAGGCSLGGYFACGAACAPFANVACPAICAVIFGAVCIAGADLSVEEACADYC